VIIKCYRKGLTLRYPSQIAVTCNPILSKRLTRIVQASFSVYVYLLYLHCLRRF